VARLRDMVLASARVFADETVVPVLDPGRGRTKQGYFWAIARDDRPWGGTDPPAVVYSYAPGRGREHADWLLGGYRGILQCDGYAAYKQLVDPKRDDGSVTLVFCWAHVRRGFYDLAKTGTAPMATEALERIAALYRIEAQIRGKNAGHRLAVRQAESRPLVAELRAWFEVQVGKLPARSPTAEAIRYPLNHWNGLERFLEDGRIELDTNCVERALRGIAMVRSLYPSSSSLWKHCDLVFWRRLTRAAFAPDRLDDPHVIEVGGLDLIGRARHDLRSRQHAGLDQPTDTVGGDAARLCGFGQREPLSVFVRGSISVDASDAPNRADPMRRPRLALSSRQPHPV
jgi:hypothetical protein